MPKGPRVTPEKPKDRKKVLRRLWGYLCRYKGMIIAALFLTFVSNILALIGPTLSGEAIDAIGTKAGEVNFKLVLYYCLLMLIFYILS